MKIMMLNKLQYYLCMPLAGDKNTVVQQVIDLEWHICLHRYVTSILCDSKAYLIFTSFKKQIYLFLFYVYLGVCGYMYVHYMVPVDARRGCWILFNWTYKLVLSHHAGVARNGAWVLCKFF